MLIKVIFVLIVAMGFAGCSPQPSYDHMVENFQENKPTFSMIATIACEIGANSGEASYVISGQSEEEKTLLELAESVDVEGIKFKQVNGDCQLAMPVWQGELESKEQQFVYRYNIKNPIRYNETFHKYQTVIDSVKSKQSKSILFDMRLSKHWFFSFAYQ
jgi:hypothetical protein